MWLKKSWKTMPLSRAIAYSNRLALVTDPFVPWIKHIASIRLMKHVPARLPVACRISSMMGIPVDVVTIAWRSVRQKRRTRIKMVPLRNVNSRLGANESLTYVVPPTPTAYTIAKGAS
jgi:hypothetical protein